MKNTAILIAGLAWSALLVAPIANAGWLPDRERIDGWLAALGGSDTLDESRRVDWGLLPGPFYTPETSFGLGMALAGLYRTDRSSTQTPLSSLTLTGFVSVTGAYGFTVDDYTYFNADRQRLFVRGSTINQPTQYWGVGYEAGRDDHPQDYTAKTFELWPQFYQRLAHTLWSGLGWSVAQMQATSLEDGANHAIRATADGPAVFSSGVSAHLLNDTRDFIPNPSRGHVLSLDYALYRPSLGSDTRYEVLITRFGAYQAISENGTLAYDLYGDFRSGDVPWSQLSAIGGDQRMRGYFSGRYRDRDTVSTQIEWRQRLSWRHGIALWAGAGTLAARPSDLGEQVLPSVGAGYRFMFKPRVNVRLDLGIGRDSAGFYFQVGEAY